jgi:hypothetical protein
MSSKKIKLSSIDISFDDINNNIVNIFPYTNNNIIAGEFFIKPSISRQNHTIILASRFNINSQEENGPFPGWFLQLIGDYLYLAIGNGKTWISLKNNTQIKNDNLYHIAFNLDNNTNIASLYVNGNHDSKNNMGFRKPCNFLTVGALNYKGEFRYAGEITNLLMGKELVEVEKINLSVIDTSIERTIDDFISSSNGHLNNIKNNLNNLKNDINSLRNVKEQIVSWKYRGLQIDTKLLDNQINEFSQNKINFENNIKNYALSLHDLDHKINPKNDKVNDEDFIDFYSKCLHNLKDDIDILDNAVNNLSKFKNLGVELGNVFDTINDQKIFIKKKIIEANNDLEEREKNIFNMMELIKINEE